MARTDAHRKKLQEVLRLLGRAHGPLPRRRRGEPIDVLVATILSQNTNGANSSAAFGNLRERFGDWEEVADASVGRIERCIHVGGLSRVKAPRIRSILRRIRREEGELRLDFLAGKRPEEALAYLTGFEGVGAKTAQCVLLFAFGMQVFPVDTHIHRIAIRLGVLDAKVSAKRAHEALAPMIVPRDRHEMHVLLIDHGRRVCLARGPRCDRCVILRHCPFGRARVATGTAR